MSDSDSPKKSVSLSRAVKTVLAKAVLKVTGPEIEEDSTVPSCSSDPTLPNKKPPADPQIAAQVSSISRMDTVKNIKTCLKYLDDLLSSHGNTKIVTQQVLIHKVQELLSEGAESCEISIKELKNVTTELKSVIRKKDEQLTAKDELISDLKEEINKVKAQKFDYLVSIQTSRINNLTAPESGPSRSFAQVAATSSNNKSQKGKTNAITTQTKQIQLAKTKQPKRQQQGSGPTQPIRIKPVDESTIEQAVKNVCLPKNLTVTKTRVCKDGSKLIFTKQDKEVREFLATVTTVSVVDRLSFNPRLKVLFVPKDADETTVKTAMDAPAAKLLRTTNKGEYKHLTFSVEPETYRRLINNRILLPGLTACRVIPCEDVPICTACLKPGHSAKSCHPEDGSDLTNRQLQPCARCGETGHDLKSCQASTPCCLNCKRAKRKVTNHSAFDKNCPEIQRCARWRSSVTSYGQ